MGRIRRSQHFRRWFGLPLGQISYYEGNASCRLLYTKQAFHAASLAPSPTVHSLIPKTLACLLANQASPHHFRHENGT